MAARRGRQYTYPRPGRSPPREAQEPGRRESTSRSRRSPPTTPALASSPRSSAADATSSSPPGGETGPLARSPSHSKPCLGTGSTMRRAAPGRGTAGLCLGDDEALARGFAGFADALAGCPARAPDGSSGDAILVRWARSASSERRAAVRRGVARWGRVRGRLARTPAPSAGRSTVPLLSLGPLTASHHCLRPAAAPRGEAVAVRRQSFPARCCKRVGKRSVMCEEALAWEPGEPMGCNVGGAAAVSPTAVQFQAIVLESSGRLRVVDRQKKWKHECQ
jgi:hypothetical protein